MVILWLSVNFTDIFKKCLLCLSHKHRNCPSFQTPLCLHQYTKMLEISPAMNIYFGSPKIKLKKITIIALRNKTLTFFISAFLHSCFFILFFSEYNVLFNIFPAISKMLNKNRMCDTELWWDFNKELPPNKTTTSFWQDSRNGCF